MGLTKQEIEKQKIERLGETRYNNFGSKMKIVDYINATNIVVEFQDGHRAKVHTKYGEFKRGEISNPYDKTVYDIGYLGEGKYRGRKHKKIYNAWLDMLQRCYNPYYLDKCPTYRDCVVCDEWHNFQNFAQWYEENYYEINNQRMCLDKDILSKGNKVYSPQTCVFVPNNINVLFVKRDNDRGKYPIGVTWRKDRGKFSSRCNDAHGTYKPLGCYDTIEDAFNAYKTFKEKIIKQVADEYKHLIPQRLYEAMYNYEIEIND